MKEDDGVRPVGVGETLRRIIGKCVTKVLGKDIQQASGTLQTCTGIESGVEAAIHAMSLSFAEESCEAVILVDADNAFNRLNRKTALHNIQRTCPSLFQYLNNSYNSPSKLHLGDGTFILSEEGVTQGDNLAMAKYAVSTRPLINSLKNETDQVKQVWFADDSAGAGSLDSLKTWWNHLKEKGSSYGYYPKPTKTHLILKNPDQLQRAEDLFAGDGVKITVEGNRHIGAVLGTDAYKEQYITEKIEKWIADVKELASIAKEEPQAALSAFNTGLSQRWTFVQRTIEGIAPMFLPLEDVIRNELIPAVCGRGVSDIERRLIALPYRWGGLGIQNPALTAEREYRTSVRITSGLTALICQQEMDISLLDEDEMKTTKQELKNEKEDLLKAEFESITEGMSDKLKKTLISAQEKGSSSWLSSLPIKKLGYTLNKQEFRDAVCLRYGWPIANTLCTVHVARRTRLTTFLRARREAMSP